MKTRKLRPASAPVTPRSEDLPIIAITTSQAPGQLGPYAQGVRAGGTIYCGGQPAIDPATNQLVPGGIKAQTRQVLSNLMAILEAGGSSLDRVVKITVFLADWKDYQEMNEAYAECFPAEHRPARSVLQGARWPEGHLVAMDAIALVA